jgi:predicted  nucleic acid-binding Zn-ribbon protein
MNFEEIFTKLKDNSVLDMQGRKEIIQLLLNKLEEDIDILQRDKRALYDKFEELESLESCESEDMNSLKTRYINISEDLRDLADIIASLEGVI